MTFVSAFLDEIFPIHKTEHIASKLEEALGYSLLKINIDGMQRIEISREEAHICTLIGDNFAKQHGIEIINAIDTYKQEHPVRQPQ